MTNYGILVSHGYLISTQQTKELVSARKMSHENKRPELPTVQGTRAPPYLYTRICFVSAKRNILSLQQKFMTNYNIKFSHSWVDFE